MQYVEKVGGYVYNQWNSLNPATLSGAIDIIVIEHADGSLHCSPWHVRFGKFRIIKPSQKKIDLYVNEVKTDLPMKLGDGGEAFFVFETDSTDLSSSLMTSPVISASSSPEISPLASPRKETDPARSEPELLDLNQEKPTSEADIDSRCGLSDTSPFGKDEPRGSDSSPSKKDRRWSSGQAEQVNKPRQHEKLDESPKNGGNPEKNEKNEKNEKTDNDQHDQHDQHDDSSDSISQISRLTFERVKRITQDLNIPSKIDVNGDVILDMDGYKPNSQKNIDSSDKLVHNIFLKEMNAIVNGNEWLGHEGKEASPSEIKLLQSLIKKDEHGQIRIVYDESEFEDAESDHMAPANLTIPPEQTDISQTPVVDHDSQDKTYIKTLRLTSEQLLNLNLQYGRNKLVFRSPQGGSQVESDLYLWKSNVPIVISDIDGTITKSDALGHVFNMFGKDWTHPGVANLFQDITRNGYNIMYLTARSVGQADTTRQYLDSINQDGMRLPKGPVILSPDRTMAALRREIILKKPEVFKMACLRDINSLFFSYQSVALGEDIDDERTPFYAGFGNRITDAISYRSVKIPSHRIFTINPNGEVHMELLELAGYKSSYLHIGELVDQFFPPLKHISDFSHGWNQHQLDEYIHSKDPDKDAQNTHCPGSPRSPMSPGSPRSTYSDEMNIPDERFTDLNYWRDPIPNLSDLSDSEDDQDDNRSSKSTPPSPKPAAASSPPVSPRLLSSISFPEEKTGSQKERPASATFSSPLKNFMIRGNNSSPAPKPMSSPLTFGPRAMLGSVGTEGNVDIDEDDDYTDDYEDDDDDDYDDDDDDDEDDDDDDDDDDEDEEDEEDDYDDEALYEDIHDHDGENVDADGQVDPEVEDEDLDLDDGLPEKEKAQVVSTEKPLEDEGEEYKVMTASDMLKGIDI
ncbi:hypothetical protein JCM33374_g2213 [Metschnikowia sp. JCM 33374]|nr:hypothetical protein JCM33374_g2213 [Metschnikowia sp. JCM 33374]